MSKFWVIARYVFLMCTALLSHADETCHCDQYQLSASYLSMATQVREIGLAAIRPDGKLYQDQQEAAALRLSVSREWGVPPECLEKVRIRAKAQIFMRATYEQSASESASSILGSDLTYQYGQLRNLVGNYCSSGGAEKKFSYCVPHSDADTKIKAYLASTSPEEVTRVMHAFYPRSPLPTKPSDIESMRIFHQLLAVKNDDDFKTILSHYQNASYEAKIGVAALALRQGWIAYDQKRDDEGVLGKGALDTGHFFSTVSKNVNRGILGKSSAADPVGVCRDDHLMAAKILKELGVPFPLTRSFLRSSGGYHTNNIVQNPERPLVVDTLDYGNISRTIGKDGGQAHYGGASDISINYRDSSASGRVIADVPSSMGLFLSDVSGGNTLKLEPQYMPQGSLITANLNADRDALTQARAFVGSDATGARYFGVAGDVGYVNGKAPLEKSTSVKAGAVLGTRHAEGSGEDKNLDFLYLQVEQGYRTGSLPIIRPDVQVRIEGVATEMFMLSRSRTSSAEDNGHFGAQGDIRLDGGIRVNQNMNGAETKSSWRNRFASTYYAGAQITPLGVENVSNNYWAQVPVPVLTHLLFTAEGRFQLSQTPEGRAYLLAAATVVVDYFGTRAKAELGLVIDKLAMTWSLQGRADENSPGFKEGAIRKVSGNILYSASKNVQIGVNGSRTLERDPEIRPAVGIGANLNIISN